MTFIIEGLGRGQFKGATLWPARWPGGTWLLRGENYILGKINKGENPSGCKQNEAGGHIKYHINSFFMSAALIIHFSEAIKTEQRGLENGKLFLLIVYRTSRIKIIVLNLLSCCK